MDRVAGAIAAVMGGTETRTNGELSTQLTQLLPGGCGRGVQPARSSMCLTDCSGWRPCRPVAAATGGEPLGQLLPHRCPDPGVPERARRELLRRFLRRCGPAVVKDLAAWAGFMPPAARSWWGLLGGELVEVWVDGAWLWMHAEDLSAAREASIPKAVRLLTPYDPLAEVAHRELLLPDSARRRQVWRAVANPGLVLIAGELAGTWRRRQQAITVAPFRPLSTGEQRAVRTGTMDRTSVIDVVFSD